ncbi:adenine deaminase [Methanothermobacter wolfeii]|uniref:Adenine deaminase n=2 Tax=Methanothermobacter TaxID=145260 RepID=A0A9E7RRJ7_METWO|nr:adenine deaminase [Methanothermobacter wolfeii]MDI6702285.1 adenine deaminase [Methanothermobacter wolfeii]MDI6842321.1 adenine deaminase [Methanothermobacter wolfeii]UXH31165.1 adenine deaminase [Methanothermobacter wolfeii]
MGIELIRGNILNVFTGDIYPAEIEIEDGIIRAVRRIRGEYDHIILPGFIDAHVHIESSMLTPSSFASAAVPHGTVAAVSDPHEIANVMGVSGIDFMISDSSEAPMRFYFTAPSCVPATPFETAGAEISAGEIMELLGRDSIVALGEMMNFPGVIAGDEEVTAKIEAAKAMRKPIDGHAPLLSGDDLCTYIAAGISTDHECVTATEAIEKRELGMKIMAREGSSAKNLRDLLPAGCDFLVSDDIHPGDLLRGHLDLALRRAVEYGADPVEAVQMVTINPASHYRLDTGAIAPGMHADLAVVDNLRDFTVRRVYIGGELVAADGRCTYRMKKSAPISVNRIKVKEFSEEDLEVESDADEVTVRVIDVMDGQIITEESRAGLAVEDGFVAPDPSADILKVSVIDRYGKGNIANGFVRGFGLGEGALASTVAHDSHNIIVVGTDSEKMKGAVDLLRESGGGLAALSDDRCMVLELPVAGLMTDREASEVAEELEEINDFAYELGSRLGAPFMTMSFLSLLVIPELKIGDRGLFSVDRFEFVDVIVD